MRGIAGLPRYPAPRLIQPNVIKRCLIEQL